MINDCPDTMPTMLTVGPNWTRSPSARTAGLCSVPGWLRLPTTTDVWSMTRSCLASLQVITLYVCCQIGNIYLWFPAEILQFITHRLSLGPLKPNDWNALELVEGFMHLYDNTNVILWRLGPQDPEQATYIATTDYPLVNKIDPDSLAVTGSHRPPITDGISMSSCSHWTREIGTDNSLNFHMVLMINDNNYDIQYFVNLDVQPLDHQTWLCPIQVLSWSLIINH